MDNFKNSWNNSANNDIILKGSKLTIENLKRAKAMLRVKKCCGKKEGDLILIYNEKFTIGRSQIASLSVRVPEVSRKHCTIRKRSVSGWEIIAEGAAGTYVNGRKLRIMETRVLSCFDEIILAGIISFIFNDYVAIPKPPGYPESSMDTYSGTGFVKSPSATSRTYLDSTLDILPDNSWLQECTSHMLWNDSPNESLNPNLTTLNEERPLTQSTLAFSEEENEARAQTSRYNGDPFVDSSTKKTASYGRDISLAEDVMRTLNRDNYTDNITSTTDFYDDNSDSIINTGKNIDADNHFIRKADKNDRLQISSSPVIRRFVEDINPITDYSPIQNEMTPLFSSSCDRDCRRPHELKPQHSMLNSMGISLLPSLSLHKKRPFPFYESALSSPEDAIGNSPCKKLPWSRTPRFSDINHSPEDGSPSSGILDSAADRRRKLFSSMMSRQRESEGLFSSNSCKTKENKNNKSKFFDFGIMGNEESELAEINRNLRLELEAAMEKCKDLINDKKTSEEIANEKLSESTKMVEELVGIKSKYIELCNKYEAVSKQLKNTTGQLEKFESMYSHMDNQDIPNGIKAENVLYIKSISGSPKIIDALNRMIEEHRENSEKSSGTVKDDQSNTKIETQNEMIEKFSDLIETELQCAICNEILVKPVMLTCSHVFCRYCIDQWKKKESHCPICRKTNNTIISALMCENFIDKFIELFKPDLKESREKMVLEREEASKDAIVNPAPRRDATIPIRLRNNMIVSLEAFRNGLDIFGTNIGVLPGVDNAAIIEDLTGDEALPEVAIYEDVQRERRRARLPRVHSDRYQREPRRTRRLVIPSDWM